MVALFPELSACAATGDFERLAILVRTYFGGADATAPRIDIDKLVDRFGIPKGRMAMADHAAFAIKDHMGQIRCSMVLRDDLGHHDAEFTLAHMLGHFFLHAQPRISRSEWEASGYREEHSPLDRYAHAIGLSGASAQEFAVEDQADRFAGALLVPQAMLKRAIEKLGDLDQVARVFGVRRDLIERRIEDLSASSQSAEVVQGSREPGAGATTSNRATQIERSNENTDHMLRGTHHSAAPTPKAMARQSYTSQKNADFNGTEEARDEAVAKLLSGEGMKRLRELAAKLDKTAKER